MQQRPIRRLLLLSISKPRTATRPSPVFSVSAAAAGRSPTIIRAPLQANQIASRAGRPQLPFLSSPLSGAGEQQFRYLTTERKRWIGGQFVLALKWTAYFWSFVAFSLIAYTSVHQEWLERNYPTPHEWRFLTRWRFRLAKWGPFRTDIPEPDWVQISEYAKNVLERLEDRKIDGDGLQELIEGGVWIDGIGNSGLDVTAKSENWVRGYYECLMLNAKAAEELDDCVVDTTRRLVFPKAVMIGPSNPNPRPIPFGSQSAPREENCDRPFPEPEHFYMRVLTTRGFSQRQKMDAALAYASWLDFKQIPDAAVRMYEWALSIACEGLAETQIPYDAQSFVIRENAPAPSMNVLDALTGLAVHKARNADVSTALPILLSILRARRSLPEPSQSSRSSLGSDDAPWALHNIPSTLKRIAQPPAYPLPPDDGTKPPSRDARERCQEAALDLYIGEMIYASSSVSNPNAREEGLAWTREAVDVSEEQLHKLSRTRPANNASMLPSFLNPESPERLARVANHADATKTCRECLDSGLENWAKMVGRLAREEREKSSKDTAAESGSESSSWLSVSGLWGSGGKKEGEEEKEDRWSAEEKVVAERTRRAADVMDELQAPRSVFSSIFSA